MDKSRDPPKINLFTFFRRRNSSTPNKNQPMQASLTTHQEPGLKNISCLPTITTTTTNPSITCINRNILAFPPRKIGCQTTIDNKKCEEEEEARRGRRSMLEKKKLPPPITSLVKSGNTSYHRPYVLQRSYKEDGRLVIHKVRVKHHEFFQAQRADGRLVFKLVHVDEKEEDDKWVDEEEDNEEGYVTESLLIGEKSNVSDVTLTSSLLGGVGKDDDDDDEGEGNGEKGCEEIGEGKEEGIVTGGSGYVVSEMILGSSMPESPLCGIGNQGGCFEQRRFGNASLFNMPIFTIRPVRS